MTDESAMPDSAPADETTCAHDWQVVNHDEGRQIEKCSRCGALKRE